MELDVKLLQNKICHTVEEIRVRTLNSILYKIQQNLIEPSHLTGEHQLYKALLKSLSYEGNGHDQALSVLDLLSTDTVGTSTLISAGGLSVINNYRNTNPGGLYNPLADVVIDKILSFQPAEQKEEDTLEVVSEHGVNCTADTTVTSLLASTVELGGNNITNNTCNNTSAGTHGNQIFPHILIDCNDMQILEKIEERLCDEIQCEDSCKFVTHVLLQDFQPEVFLQHPKIVCSMFNMLKEVNTLCPNIGREQLVIQCFTRLVGKLEMRVKLLEKCWVGVPTWNKDTDDAKTQELSSLPVEHSSALSLPRFMFGVLKSVLPVYKRCEDEKTAHLLCALLVALSALLNTINQAPINFTIDTNQLHTVFGVLSEGIISVQRRWSKTTLISSLTPALLASLVSFSISFFQHFIPDSLFQHYLPTSLVQTLCDLYTNQIFYISYRAVHVHIERVLNVLKADLVEQYSRVRLMLDTIELSIQRPAADHTTPLQLQQLYDGLEVLVHYSNLLLIEHLVHYVVENLTVDTEICSNCLIWLMSNKVTQGHVYNVLSTLTNSRYIPFPRDVLWEMIVHGLNSPPDTQLSASHTIRHLLLKIGEEARTVQLKFYRSVQPSLYFLTVALSHCTELREPLLQYLHHNQHNMTEVEVIKTWLPFLWSREESVRSHAVSHVTKWAVTQGVGLHLSASSLVVPESSKIVLTFTLTSATLDVESIEKLKCIAFNETLSEDLRVSALYQLGVLLSDGSLRDIPLHPSLLSLLCDMPVSSALVLPTVRALRHILHHNKQVRHSMSANTELYASLLRLIAPPVDSEVGGEVDSEVKAEVSTLLLLMTVHDFSDATCWTDSSYYTLYDVVLPDTVPLAFHVPAHLTTLCPARPTPPPTLPTVWIPWLQSHYYIQCSGTLHNFLQSEGLGDEPVVEATKQTLRKVYLYSNLPLLSNHLLMVVCNLCEMAGDSRLCELAQQGITSRLSDPHPSCDTLELLRYQHTQLTPALISYFISKLEEDVDKAENREMCSAILERYNAHPTSPDTDCHVTTQLCCAVFRLFTRLQQYTKTLRLSQSAANTLAITSHRLQIREVEKLQITTTLVKHIDTLSHGRGDKSSCMGAYILRKLFCTLSNVCKDLAESNINIRWIIPWLTDKDPIIRCCAMSLHFQTPQSPLTTESAVVLAVAAFSDSTELYTVRQQALYFVHRIITLLRHHPNDTTEQVYALCMLALKRLAFYNNCTAFVCQLAHLVTSDTTPLNATHSPMISTYFEDVSQTETNWGCSGLQGLFYVLDGVLDVLLVLSEQSVVMLSEQRGELLAPLFAVFTVDTLQSVAGFTADKSGAADVLEVYTLCYCKVLQLANSALLPANPHTHHSLLMSLCKVVAWECELAPVLQLKHFSLFYLNTALSGGGISTEILSEYWTRLVPALLRLLTHPSLHPHTLALFNTQLHRPHNPSFTNSLVADQETTATLSSVLFDLFSEIKVLKMGAREQLVLSVMGALSFASSALQSRFVEQGAVEVTVEYVMLVERRLRVLANATVSDKENVPEVGRRRATVSDKENVPEVGRRRAGQVQGEEGDLLKHLNSMLYALTGFISANLSAAKRLADLDYIGLVQRLWAHFSHNIVLLNTVLKSLTVFVQSEPAVSKLFAFTYKPVLLQIVELGGKAVLYSKHPVTPLQNVLFDLLAQLAAHNHCITAIWKSGFLSHFPKYEKQKVPIEKVRPWLKLLISASYTTFGQNNILAIPNLLDILLECGQGARTSTLFLVRSLVFNSKCHPKLLDHQHLLEYVLNSVLVEKPRQTLLALQIMLYFIKFSAKAKSVLRVGGAGQVLGKLTLQESAGNSAELSDTLSTLVKVYSL